MKYDFSGYATRANVLCADGRTILKDAFKHQDGAKIPLMWQHMHNSPENVIGHGILENRDDGVYIYGSFNDSESAKAAKASLLHGDLDSLSIWADGLTEIGKSVSHGDIQEVSLVLSGANPGATIDNVYISHGVGTPETIAEGEAIMRFGEKIDPTPGDTDALPDLSDPNHLSHANGGDGKSLEDVINSMNEEQKNVFYGLIGEALQRGGTAQHSNLGGTNMKRNVFDRSATGAGEAKKGHLTHSQFKTIVEDAQKCGSWKQAYLAHAKEYGIENIEFLFPDARNTTNPPEWIKRDDEWVAEVLNAVAKLPFSRFKSMAADITADEARAKGYIKGNKKKEEVFKLLKRETTPTTIYKKQKLDRDDILDATEMDVVNWLWSEMRMMLNEEIARAFLVGDGREVDDIDKINEDNIRPIWKDDELYCIHKVVNEDDPEAEMEAIVRAMADYKGSGRPVMFIEPKKLIEWKLVKDKNGRRIYNSEAEIASFLGVSKIVEVPVMENQTRANETGTKFQLSSIIVNLKDYRVGTDKGGEISRFDQFDIDYNQFKYLLETRLSAALVKPKSAIAIEKPVTTTSGQSF